MSVLVVRKPTNMEQHGAAVKEQIARGLLSADHLSHLQEAHREHYQCLSKVREVLEANKLAYHEVARGDQWPDSAEYDCIITVGGDGTLLSASQKVLKGEKVIGVRSSQSSVGYLCAGDTEMLESLVRRYLDDKLVFDSCSRLEATISRLESGEKEQTCPVLNDFLLANFNPAATTRYAIKVGSMSEVHKSSGIWVSTAVGSTAGIAAAGGQRIQRTDTRLQYLVRELYRGDGGDYHLGGGFFDPDIEPLIVENRNEAAMLALDGQREVINLSFGDRVMFKRGPEIKIARG